jgi:hypothetical protein
MPRIRTVKPQYWSTPEPPSRDARLLYVAMWNWADDEGVGTAAPKELGAFAFPYDEDLTPGDIRELLREISRSFHCIFYEVAGRPYYCIENFLDHQVINKPTPSKRPKPSQAEKLLYQDERSSTGELPEVSRSTTGTGTQEHRNTGSTCGSVSSDRSVSNAREPRNGRSKTFTEMAGGVEPVPIPAPPDRGIANDAYRLVDECGGKDYPAAVRTTLSMHVNQMLTQGMARSDVLAGVRKWVAMPKAGPNLLPSLVAEAIKDRTPNGSQLRGADKKAADWQSLKRKEHSDQSG